jgi:hypothetical protein
MASGLPGQSAAKEGVAAVIAPATPTAAASAAVKEENPAKRIAPARNLVVPVPEIKRLRYLTQFQD